MLRRCTPGICAILQIQTILVYGSMRGIKTKTSLAKGGGFPQSIG